MMANVHLHPFHFNRIICKVHNHKMKFYYIDVVIFVISVSSGPILMKKVIVKPLQGIFHRTIQNSLFFYHYNRIRCKVHYHKMKIVYINVVIFVLSVTFGRIWMKKVIVKSRPRNSTKRCKIHLFTFILTE